MDPALDRPSSAVPKRPSLHRRALLWTPVVTLTALLIAYLAAPRPSCGCSPWEPTLRQQLRTLARVAGYFHESHERCPEIHELIGGPRDRYEALDMWDRPYQVRCGELGDPVRVCSRGPRILSPDDDLCSDDPA